MLKSRYYSPKIFTKYIHSLMLQKKDFMIFLDNNQILIESEVDEWNNIHGLTNTTERVIYHYVHDEDAEKAHYRIKHTDSITAFLVPVSLIAEDYECFIFQIEREMEEC